MLTELPTKKCSHNGIQGEKRIETKLNNFHFLSKHFPPFFFVFTLLLFLFCFCLHSICCCCLFVGLHVYMNLCMFICLFLLLTNFTQCKKHTTWLILLYFLSFLALFSFLFLSFSHLTCIVIPSPDGAPCPSQ